MNVAFSYLGLKQDAFTVNDRRNEDFFLLQLIDDAIAVGNQFSDIFIVKFWDLATGAREMNERLYLVEDGSDNCAGVSGRIFCDIAGDSFEV